MVDVVKGVVWSVLFDVEFELFACEPFDGECGSPTTLLLLLLFDDDSFFDAISVRMFEIKMKS